MKKHKLCEKIIQENYALVFRFCSIRLSGDIYGAEECTQEVFLLLIQKQDEIDLTGSVDRWLLATASRIMKRYLREKSKYDEMEDCDIEEIADETTEHPAFNPAFEALTDEEYDLLLRYYSADQEARNALAKELGITANSLYQRIFALKNKVKYTKNKPTE